MVLHFEPFQSLQTQSHFVVGGRSLLRVLQHVTGDVTPCWGVVGRQWWSCISCFSLSDALCFNTTLNISQAWGNLKILLYHTHSHFSWTWGKGGLDDSLMVKASEFAFCPSLTLPTDKHSCVTYGTNTPDPPVEIHCSHFSDPPVGHSVLGAIEWFLGWKGE